ncbi:MAG TPA: efflux RND transporter periplasmic adaptor subunit [Planctomycetaceae bacterium]|jgi:HlyD family secretion protein
MKKSIGILLLVVAAAAGGVAWWLSRPSPQRTEVVLYGNLDLRQAELPFNNSERIAAVLVQEGDLVKQGQLLARLDTSRLEPQVAQAEAQTAAQRQAVEKLHHGSRPEEIAQARANVGSARADAANARMKFERFQALAEKNAVSRQDRDDAKAALDVAEARLEVSEKALELAVLGPRQEDVLQAEAQLRGLQAQLEFLKQQLKDAELVAPVDGVIRTRLMEPGELASPQKPVFSLAITDPKWVRAYVSEPDLAKVRGGMQAAIVVDSFPDRRFDGWIGFISPVAEFTPKSVQTEELRTSLVYEVRVFVKDPSNELRLGMPATVHLPLRDGDHDVAGNRSSPPAEEAR